MFKSDSDLAKQKCANNQYNPPFCHCCVYFRQPCALSNTLCRWWRELLVPLKLVQYECGLVGQKAPRFPDYEMEPEPELSMSEISKKDSRMSIDMEGRGR